MGKWSGLKGTLKQLPPEHRFSDEGGSAYQQKLDKIKEEYIGKGLHELAETYKASRGDRDKKEEELKAINAKLTALEQLMLKRMEDQGVSSFKLESGGNFIIRDEPHTTVLDKQKNKQWFVDHGLEDLLTVQWQTQNAIVKGILEDPLEPCEPEPDPDLPGEVRTMRPKPLPEGIEIYLRSSVQMRKK